MSRTREGHSWLIGLGLFTAVVCHADPAVDLDKVLQFLIDPNNGDYAWMLTKDALQFNPALKSGGRWQTRFDKKAFRRATGSAAEDNFRHKKVQLVRSKPGQILLLVENGTGTVLLRSADYGETWSTGSAAAKPETHAATKPPGRKPADQEVDVATLGEKSPLKGESTHGKSGSPPIFKAIFDLLYHLRPGISPWTFDNYHALLLVDIVPRQEVRLSFELNPSPRYYEIALMPSEKLQIRAGRIWIPFDDMNPHNTFGGSMNTSQLRQPGGAAFLPDIWADLGVAVRYALADSKEFSLFGHLYAVNGFQSGGVDPLGQVTAYPNFAGTPNVDNNSDKGLGARLQGSFSRTFSLGASFYTAKYTPDNDPDLRIHMFGVDSQLHAPPWDLRLGYTSMKVILDDTASIPDFLATGLYFDTKFKFTENWFAGLRLGIQDSDDRVDDINDQRWAGLRLGYETDWFQLSLQHMRDTVLPSIKVNSSYTAFRFVVML